VDLHNEESALPMSRCARYGRRAHGDYMKAIDDGLGKRTSAVIALFHGSEEDAVEYRDIWLE
jgi:hypothetical protein